MNFFSWNFFESLINSKDPVRVRNLKLWIRIRIRIQEANQLRMHRIQIWIHNTGYFTDPPVIHELLVVQLLCSAVG